MINPDKSENGNKNACVCLKVSHRFFCKIKNQASEGSMVTPRKQGVIFKRSCKK